MRSRTPIFLTALFAFGLVALCMVGCSRVSPNGDEEAVLISKPWFFGHGGVDETPVTAGSTWTAPTTDAVTFKITPQTVEEHFQNMMTSDNTPVAFSGYLKYQLRKGQTPTLYKKFGPQWYENSLAPTFRAQVRDKASGYKLFQLTTDRKMLADMEADLFGKISAYAKSIDLPIDIMQVTVGAITPPAEVLEQTRQTAAQNQSKLTQDARADAELARKQAEINKAIADKAYMTQMGMDQKEYLNLRALEIEKEKVELVRDKQNVSIIMGQGIVPTFGIK